MGREGIKPAASFVLYLHATVHTACRHGAVVLWCLLLSTRNSLSFLPSILFSCPVHGKSYYKIVIHDGQLLDLTISE